jgi:hypothetical protein
MKFLRALRRFIATSWLVAAPLVVMFGLVAAVIFLALLQAVIVHIFGGDAAEHFASLWFGALMWAAELTLLLAPIGLAAYLIANVLRRFMRKKQP